MTNFNFRRTIAFPKAAKALDLLLNGKTAKQALGEADLNPRSITTLKHMFPLFLGLPRGYSSRSRGSASSEE